MRLPFAPPLAPMLSSAADTLPGGEGWQFEPKWDGFRTLVFRDGDEIPLQSRDEKPMNRYFPELSVAVFAAVVIITSGKFDEHTRLVPTDHASCPNGSIMTSFLEKSCCEPSSTTTRRLPESTSATCGS